MENCTWCSSKLTACATSEFKNQITISANCPTCGEYTLSPDLVEFLPELTTEQINKTAKFLAESWQFLLIPQTLDKHFVLVMLVGL